MLAAVHEHGAKPGAAGALDVGDETVTGVESGGRRDAERAQRTPKDRRVRLGGGRGGRVHHEVDERTEPEARENGREASVEIGDDREFETVRAE